tara:strand:- start:517 stop:1983 length:1467 start_codon:yes stop_codon:yes gene_type:complete
MGGLKSAFKSIKRFVKKNTRDIATVIGFALFGVPGAAIGQGIGSLGEGRDLGDSIKSSLKVYAGASMAQGAGLQGGQGISSLNPMGKNFMFSPGNIGAGGVDPNAGRFGQFFQDVGATGRDLVSDPFGNSKTYKPVGSGDLGQSFKDMNFLQKGLTTAVGLDALGFDEMDDGPPATMPGPIDQSGYLQQGLTPATLSDVYSTGGTQTGIAGSMPSLAQNYDYDPINSSIAELLKQQDEYELEFPEFARIGMRDGGNVNMLQAIQLGGIQQPSFGGARRGAQGGDLMSVLNPIGDYIQDRINADEIGPTINEFAQTIESRFPSSDQGGGGGNMMQPYPSVGRPPSMGRPIPINNIGGNFLNKIEPLPVPGMLEPISPDGGGIQELLRNNEDQLPRIDNKMALQPTVARLADGGTIPDLDLRDTGGDIVDEEGSGDEDTVPALLADGEFVMTKQSVAGIGDGDHDQGIAQLYAMMNMNENKAQQMGIGRA